MKRLLLRLPALLMPLAFVLAAMGNPAFAQDGSSERLTRGEKQCENKTIVTAHRGSGIGDNIIRHNKFSEDSGPSAIIAVKVGACGREYDMQSTKDGALLVHHDATLNRMTNCSGPIRSHTAAWIKNRCRYHSGAPVIPLLQLLKLTRPTGGYHQQEWKPTGFTQQQLEQAMAWDQKYISDDRLVLRTASEPKTLCRLDAIYDDYANGLINRNPHGLINLNKATQFTRTATDELTGAKSQVRCVDVLMLDYRALNKHYVQQAHALGFEVSARSVNTVAAFNLVKSWGVDRVVTDKPWILQARR